MKIIKGIGEFFTECLFFGKPFEGGIIPNWLIGICAWGNIDVIVVAIHNLIIK